MDISMYTTYALRQNFASPSMALRHFYDKGVRYGDIVDNELSVYPLHLYCDFLTEAGIIPNALVSMVDIASLDDNKRMRSIAVVKGYIDQMEKLKMPLIMLAPEVKAAQSEDELKRIQELLIRGVSDIIEYTKGSGIKVTVENQSTLTRGDSKMDDIRYILDCVPNLGFVLDSGNFFCIGEDVLKAYELLSDRLVHMHAKDWTFHPYGAFVRENMPRFSGAALGEGLIPLKEIIARLKSDGYGGKVVIEVNSNNITLEMLDKSAEFLRSELNV